MFCILTVTSCCNDSDELIIDPQTNVYPPFETVAITKVITSSGVPRNTVTDTYKYDKNKRLTSRTLSQSISSYIYDTDYNLSYSDNEVIITESTGCELRYTLNSVGNAISCDYYESGIKTRSYAFEYTASSTYNMWMLSKMTEYIDDTVFSVLEFTALSNQKVLFTIDMHNTIDKVDMTFEPGNSSMLPNYFITNYHPLTFHQTAIYARILGAQPAWLTKLEPQELNESTTFSYTLDNNGWPESCKETVSYDGLEYNTTVTYDITCY